MASDNDPKYRLTPESHYDHAYLSAMTSTSPPNYGFPLGYFVIRSVAADRLLDITGGVDMTEDGAELHLWPEKEKSLVESEQSARA